MIFKCSECGEEYQGKIKFCQICGGKVGEFQEKAQEAASQNVCVSCGAKLAENAKFCHECGKPKVANSAEAEERAKPTDGVAEDKDSSFESYLRAAEKGDAKAQLFLGRCYYYGQGIAENKNKAFEWFMKAAEQGDADAQYSVGLCYERDFTTLWWWWWPFRRNTFVDIMDDKYKIERFNRLYEQKQDKLYSLIKDDNDKIRTWDYDKEALKWYIKAADQGNPKAQFHVGECYYEGLGFVTKNLNKSVDYFNRAAKAGSYNGLAVLSFITNEKLGSDIYIKRINMNSDKRKNAISDYAKNIDEENVLVLYDSTFFGSADEGFIITNNLIMITSTEPQKRFDLKGKCYDLFNSRSFKALPQEIQDSVVLLKQKYDEYSPSWK